MTRTGACFGCAGTAVIEVRWSAPNVQVSVIIGSKGSVRSLADAHGKGRKKEQELMKLYLDAGCEVWQPPRGKYCEQDIFGVGDFIVWRFGDFSARRHGGVFMVQVCHKKSKARHKRACDHWNETHPDFPVYLETYS